MTPEEEQQLIREAKTDSGSFVKLYDFYYPKILGYAFRRTLDIHLAKDITSETFLKAYCHIAGFKWKGIAFSSWLFKIATNEMNMLDRKKRSARASTEKVQAAMYGGENGNALEEEKEALERQLRQSADFIQVQQKLTLLPVKYREVIALRFFEEKSIKEIAEILARKEGTIKSLLARGIRKLKDPSTG
jgi:RNA polymerase sigma-70 factor (ECF subfamily)